MALSLRGACTIVSVARWRNSSLAPRISVLRSRIEDVWFMTSVSCHRPFCEFTSLAAIAALLLLTAPQVPCARAQSDQSSAQVVGAPLAQRSQPAAPSDNANTSAPQAATAPAVTVPIASAPATNQGNPPAQKSLTVRAVDKVKQVAKSAGDIFS